MINRSPITRLGLVVVGGGVSSYAIAELVNWREFATIAVGLALALVAAVPFVVLGTPLQLDRRLEPARVEVDRPARSVLHYRNTGSRKSSPRIVEDVVAGVPWHHDLPPLAAGASGTSEFALPTHRRGVIVVGPATIAKSDPLGILRRSLSSTEPVQLWVYPRSCPLAPLRSGFAKDVEGPTSDTSPAGDVAFHTLREYHPGDDVRHVHWLSTARTGTVMVRHYVDNRRPYLAVLVDTDPAHISPDGFERALEVAASQLRSAEMDRRPVTVVVGDQEILTPTSPTDVEGALDRLCLSTLDPAPPLPTLSERARRLRVLAPGVSALLVVTGPRPASDLLDVTYDARRHGRVVIARIVPPDTPAVTVPGARVIDCQDLDGFARSWRRVVR